MGIEQLFQEREEIYTKMVTDEEGERRKEREGRRKE
jgi:hypothetical protein